MSRRVAVFDLDHTLTRQNVSYAFGNYLYKKKLISSVTVAFLISAYALYKAHIITAGILHRLCFSALFFRKKSSELRALARSFVASTLESLLRRDARTWIAEESCQGEVLLFSMSPDFLVQEVGRHLGILHCQGTRYTEEDGLYCKVELVLDGDEKLRYFKAFVAQSGAGREDLAVYTDSIIDLPLLEYAHERIVVVPDKQLEKIALKHSWKILREDS